MKCVKIESKRNLVIDEIPEPKSIDGSVVIKVESCGICGSDIHYYDAGEPRGLVMGHEVAGTIIDAGNRKDLHIGDRVTALPISPCGKCEACKTGNVQYCPHTWENALGLSSTFKGGYSEYTNIRSDMVRILPDNMTFDEGAMVEPSAVSLHATNLADIKVGDKVLVVGGGIIGLMAVEFASLEGASYIAVLETNMARGKKATTIGKANEYFDALDTKTIPLLQEKTNGGFDVVIECCGNSAATSEAILLTKHGGKLVLVGVSTGPISVPIVSTVTKEVKMYGAIAYTEHEFATVIDLIANKKINVKKYIDATVPLEDANKSFETLTNGKSSAVKIIFHPND